MARARAVIICSLAGVALAGCGSSLNMNLVTSTGPAAAVVPVVDSSPSPSATSAASTTTSTPATAPTTGQIDDVRITVAGRDPRPGAEVKPGRIVRVSPLPSGSVVEVLRSNDAGTVDDTSLDHVIAGKWDSGPLAPLKTYTITVTTPDGSTNSVRFQTKDADARTSVSISPGSGKYGVGMPITIEFSGAVKSRAAVENALSLTVSQDIGEGAWFWPDSDTVIFRPRYFWPANTKVQVNADLSNVEVFDGVWGSNDSSKFSIGDAVIMKESLTRHDLVYFKNGEKVATFPISGGMPNWETLNGTKIVHEAYTMKRMINNAPGAHYDVEVPYAMRLTYSGEFMHAAPWNGNIGAANTSHGCTNMTYDDAVWMYNHTTFGDVFITKGGDGPSMSFGDGLGGVWDVSWPDWLDSSELGIQAHVIVDPALAPPLDETKKNDAPPADAKSDKT